MENIERMLDHLSQIAVGVRSSDRHSRWETTDQQFRSNEHKDFQKYLITILLARLGFSNEQSDPSRLHEVQQRLIHCNLKRRNRCLHAQQHSLGLNAGTLGRSAQVKTTESVGSSLITAENVAKDEKSQLLNVDVKKGTNASAVSDSLVLPETLAPAQPMSTIMPSTVLGPKFPHPPKIVGGALVFKCPYCCQTLPVEVSKGGRWK